VEIGFCVAFDTICFNWLFCCIHTLNVCEVFLINPFTFSYCLLMIWNYVIILLTWIGQLLNIEAYWTFWLSGKRVWFPGRLTVLNFSFKFVLILLDFFPPFLLNHLSSLLLTVLTLINDTHRELLMAKDVLRYTHCLLLVFKSRLRYKSCILHIAVSIRYEIQVFNFWYFLPVII
jgi:hypothetical protein